MAKYTELINTNLTHLNAYDKFITELNLFNKYSKEYDELNKVTNNFKFDNNLYKPNERNESLDDIDLNLFSEIVNVNIDKISNLWNLLKENNFDTNILNTSQQHFNNLLKYNLYDGSLQLVILFEKLTTLESQLVYYRNKVDSCAQYLSSCITVQNIIYEHGLDHYIGTIDEYDFDKLFIPSNDKNLLKSAHKVTTSVDGGFSFVKNDCDIFSSSQVWKSISQHPLTDSCGHSGFSISWTFRTLQYIYKNSWRSYIVDILKSANIKTTVFI